MAKSETEWHEVLLHQLFEAQKVRLDNLGMRMSSLADVGRTLFHYTTAQGLHGIVKDNCLWATAAAYLNDASEIEYGCNVLEEVLRKWWENNGDRSTLPANVVELLQEYFSEPALKLRRAMAVYVACFCAQDNLLSQWRAYGQAGGYSIGFSLFPKGLEGIGTRKLTGLKAENEPYRATLVRVLYKKDDQFSILEDILNRSLLSLEEPEIKSIASDLGTEKGRLIGVAALTIEQFLMNHIVAFKNKAFVDEHEWRIVVRQPVGGPDWLQDAKDEVVYVRSDRGLIIPYVKIVPTETLLPIKSVTIGPTLDKKRAEPSVKLLLTKRGHAGFEINGSDIPVVM